MLDQDLGGWIYSRSRGMSNPNLFPLIPTVLYHALANVGRFCYLCNELSLLPCSRATNDKVQRTTVWELVQLTKKDRCEPTQRSGPSYPWRVQLLQSLQLLCPQHRRLNSPLNHWLEACKVGYSITGLEEATSVAGLQT